MLLQKGYATSTGRIPWNKGTRGVSTGGRKFAGVEIICGLPSCNRPKKIAKSRVMKINFCTPEHYKEYQKGKWRWWDEKFRESQSGENSHAYKDIMVSDSALHKWVNYHKGIPEYCVNCGVTREEEWSKNGRILEWSNQSGLYLRDLADFVGRCQPCHKDYDTKMGFPRKKCFDKQGRRIGITLFFPPEYFEKRYKLPCMPS